MEESLLVWLRMYLLASQDVFIRSYIHLMSTTQLDRSRSPTMPCILLVIICRRAQSEGQSKDSRVLEAFPDNWICPCTAAQDVAGFQLVAVIVYGTRTSCAHAAS